MEGKLYTSYLSNAKKIDDSITKIGVSRYGRKVDFEWFNDLGPNEVLFGQCKNKEICWYKFIYEYKKQIKNSKRARKLITDIIKRLKGGENIVLLCYEKDYEHCHRTMLAKIINKLSGIEFEEWGINEK